MILSLCALLPSLTHILQVNLGLTPTVLPASGADLTGNLSTTGAFASADEESVSAFRASGGVVNDALRYNPRCLTRDINLFWSNQLRVKDVEFLLSCNNVDCLEKRSDGWELEQGRPQPLFHAAGHFAVGGLQNDPFASPGDPVFYLHHAAFDRVYSIWQAQDPGTRVLQVGGTKTPFNSMLSPSFRCCFSLSPNTRGRASDCPRH